MEKQELVNKVLDLVIEGVWSGDLTVIEELLFLLPDENLVNALADDELDELLLTQNPKL